MENREMVAECITRSESGGIVERAEKRRDPQLTT